MTRSRRRWARAIAGLVLAAAGAARAEAPKGSFAGAVEVDLVEVAVQVSDPDGGSVADLTASDFTVRVDGEAVEVSHFDPPAPEEPAPRTILWVDLKEIHPSRIGLLIASLRAEIPRLAERSEGVAVAVRRGRGWRLVQGFSRNAEEILAGLDAAVEGGSGNLSRSEEERLLDEIAAADAVGPGIVGGATRGPGGGGGGEDPGERGARSLEAALRSSAESAATLLLTEVRATVPRLVQREVATLAAPLPLLTAAAGMPGPKVWLWLGASLDPEPGRALLDAWLEKFGDTDMATRSGAVALEDPGGGQVAAAVDALIDRARAGRVALYLLAPPDPTGSAVRTDAFRRYPSRGAPSRSVAVAGLAAATGGQVASSVELGPLVDRLLGDRQATFGLGFMAPRTTEAALHKVAIAVSRPGLRLRYPAAFRDRSPRRRLVERALSALVFDETDNSVGFSLTPGKPRRDGDDLVVPVTVQFPLRRLTFIPVGDEQEARLTAASVPRLAGGEEVGTVASGEIPIRYPSSEMAVARRTQGTFTSALALGPGAWEVGFALRDELSGSESAARLELELADDEVTAWRVSTRRTALPSTEPPPEELPASPVAPPEGTPAGERPASGPAEPSPPSDAPGRRALVAAARSGYRRALASWVAGAPLPEVVGAWAAERAELARLPTPDPQILAEVWRGVAGELADQEPSAGWPLAVFAGELLRRHTARGEPPLTREARLAAAERLEAGSRGPKPAIPSEIAARQWLVLAADTTVREFADTALERAAALAPELDVVVLAAAAEAERAAQPARALALLERLLAVHPDRGEARLRHAIALRRLGRAEPARRELEALANHSAAVPTWVRSVAVQELAREDLAARRADLALARVRSALVDLPDDSQLRVQEGWIVDRLGSAESARKALDALAAREGQAHGSPRALYSRTLAERALLFRQELLQQAHERLAALAVALRATGQEDDR